MATAMELVERSQLRDDLPDLRVGSTVRVNYRIIEGNKERIQSFEGVGYGVERIFPLHSPRIESIKVLKIGRVRRAKLYYLRERRGKAARIKERMFHRG